MENRLDGMYTRMLCMAMNVSWKQHMTNEKLYGDLQVPKVTTKIAIHRLRLAGHCVRHPEEIASQLVLWQPVRGNTGRGRKTTDFIDVIKRDTNLDSLEDMVEGIRQLGSIERLAEIDRLIEFVLAKEIF